MEPSGHWLSALRGDAASNAPFELISPLPRDEVERRLSVAIDSEWTILGSKPVIGRVDDKSFRLRRRIPYRNSFQTIVSGTLVDDGRKTRLQCRAGMPSFLPVLAAAALGVVGIAAATLSLLVSKYADALAGHLPMIVAIGLAVPVVILAFGIALVSLGRHLARNERQQLVAFLEHTVEAKAAA